MNAPAILAFAVLFVTSIRLGVVVVSLLHWCETDKDVAFDCGDALYSFAVLALAFEVLRYV